MRLELGHKPAVRKTVLPRRRVDLNIPQSAEIAFLLASVREHVQESVHSRFPYSRDLGISSRTEPLSMRS